MLAPRYTLTLSRSRTNDAAWWGSHGVRTHHHAASDGVVQQGCHANCTAVTHLLA